jgi:hypothetical protein
VARGRSFKPVNRPAPAQLSRHFDFWTFVGNADLVRTVGSLEYGIVRKAQPGVADVDFHLDDGLVFRDGFSPTGQHLLFRAFDINFNAVQPVQILSRENFVERHDQGGQAGRRFIAADGAD